MPPPPSTCARLKPAPRSWRRSIRPGPPWQGCSRASTDVGEKEFRETWCRSCQAVVQSACQQPSARIPVTDSLDRTGRNPVALQLACSLLFSFAAEQRPAFGHFLAALRGEGAQKLPLLLRHVRGNIDPDFDNLTAAAVAV